MSVFIHSCTDNINAELCVSERVGTLRITPISKEDRNFILYGLTDMMVVDDAYVQDEDSTLIMLERTFDNIDIHEVAETVNNLADEIGLGRLLSY